MDDIKKQRFLKLMAPDRAAPQAPQYAQAPPPITPDQQDAMARIKAQYADKYNSAMNEDQQADDAATKQQQQAAVAALKQMSSQGQAQQPFVDPTIEESPTMIAAPPDMPVDLKQQQLVAALRNRYK